MAAISAMEVTAVPTALPEMEVPEMTVPMTRPEMTVHPMTAQTTATALTDQMMVPMTTVLEMEVIMRMKIPEMEAMIPDIKYI